MTVFYKKAMLVIGLVIMFMLPLIGAADEKQEFQSLDEQVESLKKEVISINRELFILEEELLFPVNTQTFFFLSMEGDTYFSLDSVELTIDGKVVSNYLYTDREIKALSKGGVQRLHVENLKKGEHEVVVVFIGTGPNGRDYRRGASYIFVKDFDPKYIELKISESQQKNQPKFSVKEWE